MQSFIQRLKADSFYRNAVLFTVASLTTSVLNYAYYPVIARLINVDQFGELQLAASFLLQLSTVFSGLNLISIVLVTNHTELVGKQTINALQKIVFWLFMVVSVAIILLSPLLANFFHFKSLWPIILVVPSLLVSALSVFWTAFLQAKKDFKSLSIYSVTTGSGKILFSVILVLLGLGAGGGVLGIALGLALSLFIVRLISKRQLPKLISTLSRPTTREINLLRPYLSYIFMVVFSLLIMSVLLSIDVFIVKRLFTNQEAGLYAGISTISRILFFASAPIIAVMLPEINRNNPLRSASVLMRTLALSVAVCVTGLVIFSIFPEFITTLLLGEKFKNFAQYLPLLSLLATIATISNVTLNYSLGMRDKIVIPIIAVSVLASILLAMIYHHTIYQIIYSICASLVLGQLVFGIHFITSRKRAA